MTEAVQIPLNVVDLGEGSYHIFCSLIIEGKELNALIDTGANKSVISLSLSEELSGLTPLELEENRTAGIGKDDVESEFVMLDSLQIGPYSYKDQIIGLLDLEHVDEMYHEMGIAPFQFIIGGDLLMKAGAVIDYSRETLTLSSRPLL